MASIHKVLRWADENGDERVLARIRVFCLSFLLREGIELESVGPTTTCSAECLAAIIRAAESIVGSSCPYAPGASS